MNSTGRVGCENDFVSWVLGWVRAGWSGRGSDVGLGAGCGRTGRWPPGWQGGGSGLGSGVGYDGSDPSRARVGGGQAMGVAVSTVYRLLRGLSGWATSGKPEKLVGGGTGARRGR